jgi:hypothetical protein
MSVPKRKNNIKIYKQNELTGRREQLLNEITKSDTFLPDSLLHDDLDRGMLNYVLEFFNVISNGEQIPIIPKILTIQRWGEISNSWEYSDDDRNIKVPFISVVRKPDAQPGTNPSVQRTIPDRKTFFYHTVPTWDGNKKGFDIYKIPQPVAVDITYTVTLVTDEIRDLNKLNKIILEKFSSRQSYTNIKGHYIPIVLNTVSDSSNINSIDTRRFYVQNYEFTLLGLIVDSEEFEVIPGIDRTIITTEFVMDKNVNKKIIDGVIETTVTKFSSDGNQVTYSVGEPIGKILYVTINGLTQNINTNYYHISNTSKITFVNPPSVNDKIYIAYTKNQNTEEGGTITISNESFVYDGTTLVFTTQNTIKDIVYVMVNGYIDDVKYPYTFIDNEITLLFQPTIDSIIGFSYIY